MVGNAGVRNRARYSFPVVPLFISYGQYKLAQFGIAHAGCLLGA